MSKTTEAFTHNNLPIDFEAINTAFSQAAARDNLTLTATETGHLLAAAGLTVTSPPVAGQAGTAPLCLRIHNNREFGMLISIGIGGPLAEAYQAGCREGQATTTVSALLSDADTLLELFKQSIAYQQLAATETEHLDPQLLTLFRQLISIANNYSPANADAQFIISELVLDPLFIATNQLLLDTSFCRIEQPSAIPAARPIEKIDKMMHPASIGIIGVSASKMNFGRIILKNLIDSGYPKEKMTIIRPGEQEIDGVKCVESLAALPHKLDLFIVAVAADAVFGLVDEVIATDAAESVMLIPGGLGETEASRARAAEMSAKINEAHRNRGGGPIFLGGNCLGIVSHPGQYDSWFIPKFKLPKPQKKQQRNSALISQSGAFMITRLSQNPWFDPNYMAALGNQNDLTHSDMVNYFAEKSEIDLIGVYVEGFKKLDGLAFTEAVRRAILRGKQVVVYKAGQSSAGQAAALGHTASIAGVYEVCNTLLQQAGAIVARSFTEFNDLFYIADCLHHKSIGGNRLGAISGAGFETVGMADSIHSDNYSLTMGELQPETHALLAEILKSKRLDALMEIRNPFDINPGADDEAHTLCTQAFVDDPNIDAVVVGLDPLSPMMRTLVDSPRPGFDINSEESITQQLPRLVDAVDKPIIGIVDGGALYDPMIEMLKDRGVCTFRSCDQGVRALTKYIEARLRADRLRQQQAAE